MGKTELSVYSTARGYLGNKPPKKCKGQSCNACGKYDIEDNSGPGALYPAGIEICSDRENIQDNQGGVTPLYPVNHTRTVIDLRSQLSEGVRIQFMGEMELFDILDSEKFTFGKFDENSNKITNEASYKINPNGILNISWETARTIQENSSNELTELQTYADEHNMLLPSNLNTRQHRKEADNSNGVSPMIPPQNR